MPVPMLRLLQGDVGSGKTAVALLAAIAAVDSGYQAAILVPNEVLAQQHLKHINAVLDRLEASGIQRPCVELLIGNIKARCRARDNFHTST